VGRRLITLLGALVIALLVGPIASAAPATAEAVGMTRGTDFGFYCGAATTSVPCRPCHPDKGPDCQPSRRIAADFTSPVFASIDNQAAGGEVCRLDVIGIDGYNNVWFNAGDYDAHNMGTVPGPRGMPATGPTTSANHTYFTRGSFRDPTTLENGELMCLTFFAKTSAGGVRRRSAPRSAPRRRTDRRPRVPPARCDPGGYHSGPRA
jgi:hypothetical protein